jgi:acetoin utilization deacetylase AcuC-like enzyme
VPLHLWSSSRYAIPLPPGHRFPVEKYAMLRERVVSEGLVAVGQIFDPPRAMDVLLRVHAEQLLGHRARCRTGSR